VPEARYFAVVPAAGTGSRMGAARPKQYLALAGRPVLAHTLARLASEPRIETIVVCIARDDRWWPEVAGTLDAPVTVADGGAERAHSVLNGLDALAGSARPTDWVLVHDAVRPCLRPADLHRLIEATAADPVGGLLAARVSDTLKRADAAGRVEETVGREGLWRALTPQIFRFGLLRDALVASLDQGQVVTDEAAAVERLGARPLLVEGHSDNIKITVAPDLGLAERVLELLELEK